MRTLAIDTAHRRWLCAAVFDAAGDAAGRVVRDQPVDRALPPLLAELGLAGLGAVVATTGPGSLTGVRAGMAAAVGVASALSIPLFGTGSLEVVAWAAPEDAELICAVAEAGRGGLFVAGFDRRGGRPVPVEAPVRVEAAGWRPQAGAVVVALDRGPEGLQVPVAVADPLQALVRAARAALEGAPIEPARWGREAAEPRV